MFLLNYVSLNFLTQLLVVHFPFSFHIRFKGIIKALSGMSVLTSTTFSVIWSSVLISVTREWRRCKRVYKFFRMNNIEQKCSFARCRKYHKS